MTITKFDDISKDLRKKLEQIFYNFIESLRVEEKKSKKKNVKNAHIMLDD